MEVNKFKEQLNHETKEMERIIRGYLPAEEGPQKVVLEAMNYSVLAGGKRLRPILMCQTWLLCGGNPAMDGTLVSPFLAALEMIHTYSLVHDDLPAMDNDQYRRGKKTTWAVFGETNGILAGDGLLNYAFETAAKAFDCCNSIEDYKRVAKAMKILAGNAGIFGMIGGQTADMEAENAGDSVTQELLLFIHEHKTARLIQAAMCIGAVLAGAEERQVEALNRCAYNLGVAFQIQDDILDVIGNSEELGKPVGSDAENHKQTYVTMNGLDKSMQEVERLSEEAVQILDSFEGEKEFLKELVISLIHRQK